MMRKKEKVTAWLEGLLPVAAVILMGALLLGPGMIYLTVSVIFFLNCYLLVVSPEWRTRYSRYFEKNRLIWALVGVFCAVFAAPFIYSDYSTLKDISELKWVLIWLVLLFPIAVISRMEAMTNPLRWAIGLLVVLTLASFFDGFVKAMGNGSFPRETFGLSLSGMGGRASGFLRNPISFAYVLGSFFWIVVSGVLLPRGRKNMKGLIFSFTLMAVCFACIIFSQTRGAWLAMAAVGFLSLPALPKQMRRVWLAIMGVACAAGLILTIFHSPTRERLFSAFEAKQPANQDRLQLWEANFLILKDHPFGIGYNANDQLIGGKFDELGFERSYIMGHSHNEYIEIAVGSGWLGIGLYLLLSAWILLRTVMAVRKLDFTDHAFSGYLLLSSALIQIFLSVCALTDQMNTPGRILFCMAWAVAIVVPVELAEKARNVPIRS